MTNFTITVERITTTTHVTDLSIEADTEDDAIEKALVEASNGAVLEKDWDFEDEEWDYDTRDISPEQPDSKLERGFGPSQ